MTTVNECGNNKRRFIGLRVDLFPVLSVKFKGIPLGESSVWQDGMPASKTSASVTGLGVGAWSSGPRTNLDRAGIMTTLRDLDSKAVEGEPYVC